MFRSLTFFLCAAGATLFCGDTLAEVKEPVIIWSEPQNGLALGVEQPSQALIFEPAQGWKGPLVIREDHQGGYSMRSNPGGAWSATAVIKVYLKNTSAHAIAWASDRNVWRLVMAGAKGKDPETTPFPGSHPPELWKGPKPLEPGARVELKFHVSEAAEIWGAVQEGDYVIKITYAPDALLKFASGGEGHWVHPYDVPGFWKGTLTAPPLNVRVKHP